MSARSKVTQLLNDVGAVLKRQRNHQVWQLPNGKNFVRACTPRGQSGDLNNLSQLKRELGVTAEVKQSAPTQTQMRRRKPTKTVSHERLKSNVASLNLAESLRMAGLSDDALRDRLDDAETRLGDAERQITTLQTCLDNNWAVRASTWLQEHLQRSPSRKD